LAQNLKLPLVRLQAAGDQGKEGGLAATGRPGQGDALVGLDLEGGNPEAKVAVRVAERKVLGVDDGGGH
jgi:hypothetical protein